MGTNQDISKSSVENEESHETDEFVQSNWMEKDSRRGKPIPGFAREIILKVAAICDQEAKDNFCKYSLNAPTKRAATYTGVSERTIQRIRNADRKKRNVECEDNEQECIPKKDLNKTSCHNTMKRISKKGQAIPKSARDIISKVIDACDKEHKDGEYLEPLISKSKRTALYTGVSQRTVQRIRHEDERRNEVNQDKVLNTPGKRRKRSTFNDKIDDFDFHIIRSIIDDLILVKKVNPSCTSLHAIIKKQLDFQYSEDTLYRLLHSKGFEWCKGAKGKRTLMEKPEIFKERLNYLTKIKEQEILGKFVVYLDDKWISEVNQKDICKDHIGISQSDNGVCCSGRLVMLNEFSTVGFVRRAEKLLKPNLSESVDIYFAVSAFIIITNNILADFGTEHDIPVLESWFKEKLFPNIPPDSMIIMSTDSYEQYPKDLPKEHSSKSHLIEFLKEKNLNYSVNQTCSELYRTIEGYIKNLPYKWKAIDSVMENYGHSVLRLPSYMSQFNPIELAWADLKRSLRDRNKLEKISSKTVQELTLHCFQMENLQGYVNHVIQMEDYFWDREHLMLQYYNNFNNGNIMLTNLATYNIASNLQSLVSSNMHVNIINENNSFPTDVSYAKNIAIPVLDKDETLEDDLAKPGPSYLNL